MVEKVAQRLKPPPRPFSELQLPTERCEIQPESCCVIWKTGTNRNRGYLTITECCCSYPLDGSSMLHVFVFFADNNH